MRVSDDMADAIILEKLQRIEEDLDHARGEKGYDPELVETLLAEREKWQRVFAGNIDPIS